MAHGKLRVLAAAVLAAALAFGALSGCSGGSAASGDTLRVGVRDDIMNFSYFNEQTSEYYGLEVDLANELADRLGYDGVEFSTVTPDDRKDVLLAGDVDCLVACYSIADSRLENFDFSPAYYDDEVVVVVENSSLITSIEQLQGGTFGIMSGSNAGPLLAQKLFDLGMIGEEVVSNTDEETVYTDARVLKYPTYQELSRALEEGEVDAAVMDGAISFTYMNDDRSTLPTAIAEQSYGVATQKGSELSARVSEAIQGMIDDGTVAALVDKWN